MTSIEEAAKCPKCSEPGRLSKTVNASNGNGKVRTYICENERCRWYSTGWVVQVDISGQLVEGNHRGSKSFEALSKRELDYGRHNLEEILQKDLSNEQ